jgi:hypothetical protein
VVVILITILHFHGHYTFHGRHIQSIKRVIPTTKRATIALYYSLEGFYPKDEQQYQQRIILCKAGVIAGFHRGAENFWARESQTARVRLALRGCQALRREPFQMLPVGL